MRRIGPRLAALLVLSLLVGLNLVLPAGAHVTKKLPHLFRHLDPRYTNVNEMAANSNLLDGQDSTAFLGAAAKAADADLLDGQNSTAFMAGPGKVIEGAVDILPSPSGDDFFLVLSDGALFEVAYMCPDPLADNGVIRLTNITNGTVNMFTDNGLANPIYQQVPADSAEFPAAFAAGEFITFQLHAPNVGIATIHVMSVHRASDCHVQAQAVISS
jgi:hypothetical protein